MEIQFFGGNCVRIASKKGAVVVDDNLAELGAKPVVKLSDIALFTHSHKTKLPEVKLVIEQPGEYEVSDISIQGIAARAHMDEAGKKTATIFKITADDVRIGVLGHVYPELDDTQLEALGTIDILVVPVGDSGYTMDSIGALKLIKKIEPKVIIPTHYQMAGIKYEVPQQSLEEALKGLSMEPSETAEKLKIKHLSEIGETTRLVILEKQ